MSLWTGPDRCAGPSARSHHLHTAAYTGQKQALSQLQPATGGRRTGPATSTGAPDALRLSECPGPEFHVTLGFRIAVGAVVVVVADSPGVHGGLPGCPRPAPERSETRFSLPPRVVKPVFHVTRGGWRRHHLRHSQLPGHH